MDLRTKVDVLSSGAPPSTTSSPTPRVLFVSAASGLAQDRAWIVDLRSRYDLVHWHGGVDGLGATCARRMVAALVEAGKPLVLTLESDPPTDDTHADADTHDDALAVLVRAAAAVIVADEDAASAALARWQRRAVVIADPEADDDSCDEIYRSVVAGLS